MDTKLKLKILNFLQFFAWGAWLLTVGSYIAETFGPNDIGWKIGAAYGTMGFASLFMPALLGIVADKWVNAERVLGISHLILGGLLIVLANVTDYSVFYPIIFLVSMFYMPTIALDNAVSYAVLEKEKFDIIKVFPPIRVWGTVGFILAVWTVNIFGWRVSINQFYLSAGVSIVLGLYSFTLPQIKPSKSSEKKSLAQQFGLDAFVLFKRKKMAIFFIFAMLLGCVLQISNMWGEQFLDSFKNIDIYKDSFIVENALSFLSLSMISEALFILSIPFFLKRFGIKQVMLMSMVAWALRFALFGIGNPGTGIIFLTLSMIVYGMAFDFFNISGSLFVEKESNEKIRSSSQGLFMLMTNGLGAIIGAYGSGYVVDLYSENGVADWPTIWFIFAIYSVIVTIAFALVFKYKHDPNEELEVKH
ncbi:MAG: MFS transporter [Fluviicola sp.]|nr:MFS transporter [Fluviicola sp.]